jgi:hypothetical protein
VIYDPQLGEGGGRLLTSKFPHMDTLRITNKEYSLFFRLLMNTRFGRMEPGSELVTMNPLCYNDLLESKYKVFHIWIFKVCHA